MFKKFFVSCLAFAMLTVHANAGTNQGLKAAFDDLNYSLTVEWDQKDRAFHDAKMRAFSSKVAELQAQGLTNADLLAFAKSQIHNAALARDVEAAFNLIQINNMSIGEANTLVRDMISKSYSTGASWSGSALLLGGLGILLILAAVSSAGSGGTGGGYGCGNEYVCYDVYDSWGYYWYTDCGYEYYCY